MKKLLKRPKTTKAKATKGSTIMTKAKIIVPTLLVICAVVIGTLVMMGPKQRLQTPPIEPKALAYLEEHSMLQPNEQITGYKALSYYNYDRAAVITDKRIFVYNKDKVFSIPLNQITLVFVKDSVLGQQEVLISAQRNGTIDFGLYHSSVPELIKLLGVPGTIVKHEVMPSNKQVAEQEEPVHAGKI